jgi:4-hydroxy-3-polyprenylbenzoate decarboxylase
MADRYQPIAVAITGASGATYAMRLLECLVQAGETVHLMLSEAGQIVVKMELGLTVPARSAEAEKFLAEHLAAKPGQVRVFGRKQWTAPVASGSNPPRAMVVCPCTTGTLSSIAAGTSDTLIERAADVALKERRRLILVLRETPLSPIHLENMLKLARAGAVIMPANPGFYCEPHSVEDLVDFIVARILDHLEVPHELGERWGDPYP